MPPFRSRLFNWIYHSLPFQWGRRARYTLSQWLQELPRVVKDTVCRLFPSAIEQTAPDRAQLPPWRRFLTKTSAPKIIRTARDLAPSPKHIIPDRWRALLEEAINYFLRRPKLSPRHQEYENESAHWPPLPPTPDPGQITEVKLEPEEPPLRAWIDTQATSLGYAYSPIVNFFLWLDGQVERLEQWLSQLWRKFWRWLTTYRPA